MSEDDLHLLRRMPVFGGLNDEALTLLLKYSKRIAIEAGEFLFQEGDGAESIYVITDGSVVVQRSNEGTTIQLSSLGRGDCVGEMALIDLMPRSAAALAEQACEAIEISRIALHQLYKMDVEQYAIIMMNMGREVSRRLRVADDRLFMLGQQLPEMCHWPAHPF